MNDYLAHFGVSKRDGAKVGSGRYPLGSGKNPKRRQPKIRKLAKGVDVDAVFENYRPGLSGRRKIDDDFDFTLKKGTKFQRIGNANEKDDHDRTYVSFLPSDNDEYLKDFSDFEGKHLLTLDSIDDIKVAGIKARTKAMLKVLGNYTPREAATAILYGTKEERDKDSIRRFEKDHFEKSLSNPLNLSSLDTTFGLTPYTRRPVGKKYMKELQKRGYDAFIDGYDKTIRYAPLVVIDRAKSLRTINVSDVQDEDIEAAKNRVDKFFENGYQPAADVLRDFLRGEHK